MQVLLANPRGFCAGVDRAIDIVERALELFGPPIYVRHEVVHNRHVVERLRGLGAVFVDELGEVPASGTVIFSAHGVSSAVEQEARDIQPAGQRDVPQRHSPARGGFLDLFEDDAFVHVGAKVEQQLDDVIVAVIDGEGEKSAAARDLAQQLRLGGDHLAHTFDVG